MVKITTTRGTKNMYVWIAYYMSVYTVRRRDHIIGRYRFTGKLLFREVFYLFFNRYFLCVPPFRVLLVGGFERKGAKGVCEFGGKTPPKYIYIRRSCSHVRVCLRCTHLGFRRPTWAASIPGSLAASADPCLPLTVFVLYICGNNTSNHYSVRYLPQNKHAIRSIHLVLCVYMYIVNIKYNVSGRVYIINIIINNNQ